MKTERITVYKTSDVRMYQEEWEANKAKARIDLRASYVPIDNEYM